MLNEARNKGIDTKLSHLYLEPNFIEQGSNKELKENKTGKLINTFELFEGAFKEGALEG